MDDQVLAFLRSRGVRRLAHFSPTRNLHRILATGTITSARTLIDVGQAFAATDKARHDGHPEMTCASIEYPNVFYLKKAMERDPNFPGWAIMLLKPEVAAHPGVLFSTRNASAAGASIAPGASGIEALYADEVRGAWGRTYARSPLHLAASPTDLQAEVLLPHDIPLGQVLTVALPSAAHVAQERGHLSRVGVDPNEVEWSVAPGMFDVTAVQRAVADGAPITEVPWKEAGT